MGGSVPVRAHDLDTVGFGRMERFEGWQWIPVDSAEALQPFVPHPFYDPEGMLIPIPSDVLVRYPELVHAPIEQE